MTTALHPPLPAGTVPWTGPDQAEQIMSVYVSPVVGIVRKVYERLRDVDELYTYSTGGESCDARVVIDAACNRSNGGCGTTPREARLGAIGETVERYSAAWAPLADLVHGSHRELTSGGYSCLSPDSFTPFANWQYNHPDFPYARFTTDTPLDWTESTRLSDTSRFWLPAQLVYLRRELLENHPIAYPTSNGLAYGCTTDEALTGGILELIERDAVMLTWYKQIALPRIDIDSDPQLKEYFDRNVRPTGLSVSLIDLSAFSGVSAILAVVRNDRSAAAPLGLGAAASATPLRAAIKAVNEGVSTRGWAMIKQRTGETVSPDSDFTETIHTFDNHIALYTNQSAVPATTFLDSSDQIVGLHELPSLPADSPGALRDALVANLTERGVDLYAVDATSPDVIEGGGSVVRVFSPQLQPLDVGYRSRYLGNPRIHTLPPELGLVPATSSDYLNPMPHPFP